MNVLSKKWLKTVLSGTALTSTIIMVACNDFNLDSLTKDKQAPGFTNPSFIRSTNKSTPTIAKAETQMATGKIAKIQDPELKLEINDYLFELVTNKDGDHRKDLHGEGFIDINGLGKHKVKMDQKNYPLMSNKNDEVTITDETSENIRTYSSDQDLFRYIIKDGEQELIIELQPDGTWLIDGQSATTLAEAAQKALKSPILSKASLHGMAMMYALSNSLDKDSVEFFEPKSLTPTIDNSPTNDKQYRCYIRCNDSFSSNNSLSLFYKETIKLKLETENEICSTSSSRQDFCNSPKTEKDS